MQKKNTFLAAALCHLLCQWQLRLWAAPVIELLSCELTRRSLRGEKALVIFQLELATEDRVC